MCSVVGLVCISIQHLTVCGNQLAGEANEVGGTIIMSHTLQNTPMGIVSLHNLRQNTLSYKKKLKITLSLNKKTTT